MAIVWQSNDWHLFWFITLCNGIRLSACAGPVEQMPRSDRPECRRGLGAHMLREIVDARYRGP
jgi:hypothetical protein